MNYCDQILNICFCKVFINVFISTPVITKVEEPEVIQEETVITEPVEIGKLFST